MNTRMRENKLRSLIRQDELLLGMFLDFPSGDIIEFSAWMGFNWVLIDAEHVGVNVESCYNLVRAADAVGIASVIRVPDIRPETVLAFADTGVSGIIGPHIRSLKDAETLVSGLRYGPLGVRGASAGSRAANYGFTQSPSEYFAAVDTHPVAMALLEDVEAYDDALEDIAALPGIEVLCLGKMDLSISAGVPGQLGHAAVQDRVKKAAAAARKHGKMLNEAVQDAASIAQAEATGTRMLVGSAQGLLGIGGKTFIDTSRAAFAKGNGKT